MLSTMQDGPLLVSGILRHGQQVYGDSRVVTIIGPAGESVEATVHRGGRAGRATGQGPRAARHRRQRPGRHVPVEQPDPPRGVPGRAGHGGGPPHPEPPPVPRAAGLRDQPRRGPGHHRRRLDRPLLARVRDQLPTVRHIVVVGEGDTSALGETLVLRGAAGRRGARLRLAPPSTSARPRPCVTPSGTTGNPKGVVYSHRSTYLHSMAITSGVVARHQRAGPGALHRPDVPRQRLGHPVRRRS